MYANTKCITLTDNANVVLGEMRSERSQANSMLAMVPLSSSLCASTYSHSRKSRAPLAPKIA